MDQVLHLARLAQDAGLDGVVASPLETARIRAQAGPGFASSRRASAPRRRRAATTRHARWAPAEAMQAGATYLVVGRPITGAPDPRAAAEAISAEIDAVRA